jgi:ATP-dependent Clp protease ATP-binding subunit ClpB
MLGITEIQLKRLEKRLEANKIEVNFDISAKEYLANKGFDEVFGARPLKRVIQSEVENFLANQMIAGKITPNSKIVITAKEGEGLKFALRK